MEAKNVTEEHFWRYRQWALKLPLQEYTVHTHLIVIKQVFKWAARQRFIPENPLSHISLKEPPSNPQFCPTTEQVAQLLAAAEPEDRPLFAFLAFTGCRIGEARDLGWDDLTMNPDGTGHIFIRKGGSNGGTKTGKVRRVPISAGLRPYLDALPRKTKLVFTRSPSGFDPGGMEPINVRKALNRLQKAAQAVKVPQGMTFKLHSMRHFFTSTLAAKGAPERYVKGMLGHSSSTITDLYFSMYDDAAKEVVDRITLPTIPPPKSGEGGKAAGS